MTLFSTDSQRFKDLTANYDSRKFPLCAPHDGARRRTKRLKLAFAHLYQHITDLTLRKMLVDEAHNDGETAWQVVQRECDFPVTELELEDMKRNVRALTIIGTVGYHGHSISFFRS